MTSIDNIDNIGIFTYIYQNKIWGDAENDYLKGSSGPGSSVESTAEHYTPLIRKFIEEHDVKSVVDLGCGDWQSSSQVFEGKNDVKYCGYDAYENVILHNTRKYPNHEFHFMDIVKDIVKVKNADLYILKDVLQHLNYDSIYYMLDNIIKFKKAKYILITNDTTDMNYADIKNGGYRPINWEGFHFMKYVTESLLKYNIKHDPRVKEIVLIKIN